MRCTLVVLALGMLAGCSARQCKPGTVQVKLSFDGDAASADQLEFTITVGASAPVQNSIGHPPGHSPDTTQLTFSSYPAGASLTVDVVATQGGQPVGFAHAATTLAASCTFLPITVDAGSSPTGDMGVGGPMTCTDSSSCASGNCVDGYCCDTACTDSCSACDVSGKEGTCSPVTGAVHGTRTACTNFGMAPCGGSCDGTSTQCTYPTVTCGNQSCTSGVATASGTCSMGTCTVSGPMMTNCADKLCGADACETVTQIAVGGDFMCALLSDKTVRCWGNNKYGQLGQGGTDTTTRTKPTPVPGLSNVTYLAAGDSHVCAIVTNPTTGATSVECWGYNGDGELGMGGVPDTAVHATPTAIAGLTGVKELAAGSFNTCAVLTNQQVQCWGDNFNGQIGDGTSGTNRTIPTTVCASGSAPTSNCTIFSGAVHVGVGVYHTCAVNSSGNVYCWGANDSGELGLPQDSVAHPNPVLINNSGVGGLVVTQIAVGAYSVCALSSDGMAAHSRVACWGNGSQGQLGSGSVPAAGYSTTPAPVCTTANCAGTAYLTGVTNITMGKGNSDYDACAVASSAVYCWGHNDVGQLGLGSTDTSAHAYAVPSLVTASSMATSVATSGLTSCAVIGTGGTLRCWGYNGANALIGTGDTTTMDFLMPTAQSW